MPDSKLPPPLPPRPFQENPFRDVREEEALRSAVTPPERPVPQPTLREVVDTIGALRRQLVNHAEKLDAQQPPAGPSVVSIPPSDAPPKSRAVVAVAHTWNVTKILSVAQTLTVLAWQIAASLHLKPGLVGPLQLFAEAVGKLQ